MNLSGLTTIVKSALPLPLLETYYASRYRGLQIDDARRVLKPFRNRRGIEIGGPSAVFRQQVPVYRIVGALDGVNFAGQTMWEGSIEAGRTFRYHGDAVGAQYILDATDLGPIDSHRYYFLLSSNCLEHVANPLKAMHEWVRVVVPGGPLLLVLPRASSNFDHRRPVTTFAHLLADWQDDIAEDDMTHLPEILALHDYDRDPPARDREHFEARSRDNLSNRGLHHHVFDEGLIEEMFAHLGVRVLHLDRTETDYIAIGRTASTA